MVYASNAKESSIFGEAQKCWKLSELYKDLGAIKGGTNDRKLTDLEKQCLRGLLCFKSPQEISSSIGWKLKALRVELTRTIYQYVKILTDRVDTKIHWYDVPKWLEKEGYKLEHPAIDENLLDSISKGNTYTDVGTIIALVENNFLHGTTPNSAGMLSSSALGKMLEVGDELSMGGNYESAIELYMTLLKQMPSQPAGILLKIAQIYNYNECYSDSARLTYFSLQYAESAETRGKLYHLLAIAFDELCRKRPNPGLLTQALHAYGEAIFFSKRLNAVILWNKCDLILDLIVRHPECYSRYNQAAQLAWNQFKYATGREGSNFRLYRDKLVLDIQLAYSKEITNEHLKADMAHFLEQYR